MPVKAIKFETAAVKAIVFVPALFCVVLAFLSVKWSLGNTASLRNDPGLRPEFREIAELTTSMAPDDPQTHYASAVLHQKTFLPADLSVAVSEFEKATALAPYNYLIWLELGRARERNGDAEGGERALRKALELAPNYSSVQWALGNNLLRQGRTDEAFVEIRKAGSGDEKYNASAAPMAWDFFEGDLPKIRQAIGDSPRINAALSHFLGNKKMLDDAFAIWSSLPAEEKRAIYRQNSETLFGQLIEGKKYREAVQVYSQALIQNGDAPVIGKINNGSFEGQLKTTGVSIFDWQLADGTQPQISPDAGQKRSGERSLVLLFNSNDGKDFRAITQTVAVEASKTYTLAVAAKSDLQTAATFKWEVVDAADGKVIGVTESVAAVSDWTALSAKFTTGAATEAVIVRLARAECRSVICPISGRVWFDDLVLNAG